MAGVQTGRSTLAGRAGGSSMRLDRYHDLIHRRSHKRTESLALFDKRRKVELRKYLRESSLTKFGTVGRVVVSAAARSFTVLLITASNGEELHPEKPGVALPRHSIGLPDGLAVQGKQHVLAHSCRNLLRALERSFQAEAARSKHPSFTEEPREPARCDESRAPHVRPERTPLFVIIVLEAHSGGAAEI